MMPILAALRLVRAMPRLLFTRKAGVAPASKGGRSASRESSQRGEGFKWRAPPPRLL